MADVNEAINSQRQIEAAAAERRDMARSSRRQSGWAFEWCKARLYRSLEWIKTVPAHHHNR
jgi:hypothetical protein